MSALRLRWTASDEGAGRRVLLVTPQPFYAERGTPIAVRYVIEAVRHLGFEIDVVTLPIGRDVRIPGVRVLRVPNPFGVRAIPVGFSLHKLVFDAFMLVALAWRMRTQRYACVHAVEEGALLALLARGGRKVPVIYDMASALSEQLAQKSLFRLPPVQAVIRWIERSALRRAAVVVYSAGLVGHVRDAAPKTRSREWRFPAPCREPDPGAVAALRAELEIPEGAPVVLYAGNFASYQGLDLLLAAAPQVMRQIPEAVFVLVGAADPDEADAILGRIADCPRANIRCLVRQPRERIDTFIDMADVLVSPRNYGGNVPLKVFDYLASGKPIVATDVPTHRVVLDDSLALLVPPDAGACAAGITRVLTERDLATKLAATARDYARRELSWDQFVSLIEGLYEQAMGPQRPAAGRSGGRDPQGQLARL